MPRARKVCSRCPGIAISGRSMCTTCEAASDRLRGTARQRGYTGEHETRFRAGVLARDPTCVLCGRAPSAVADHYPLSRRELVARGMDPNDPEHGRGLCASCHGRATATNPAQRGGWNA